MICNQEVEGSIPRVYRMLAQKKKGQKRPSKIFWLNLAEKNKRDFKYFCNFRFFDVFSKKKGQQKPKRPTFGIA